MPWYSYGALPHYVGSCYSRLHCKQRAMEPLVCTFVTPASKMLQYIATLRPLMVFGVLVYSASMQWVVTTGAIVVHCQIALGARAWRCPTAAGNGTPSVYYLTAGGQWTTELLPHMAHRHKGGVRRNALWYIATIPQVVGIGMSHSTGPWGSVCGTLPHWLQALGSGTCVELFPSGGSGKWDSRGALPHWLRTLYSGSRAVYYGTTWRQWAPEYHPNTAALPWGSGEWKSCTTPAHYLGALGVVKPTVYTTFGQ